ncbi:hypothetical protein GYA27_03140 [candidate division WWE3 bacterium]|uniref:Uncharacterized protein n=1 Tax=candidate division WWE3 bacterium TaxID=2053526 RepID=A0A7X9DKL4_UNCKA|nr:hypothetical protein [candidate division WWE3 bacterium]
MISAKKFASYFTPVALITIFLLIPGYVHLSRSTNAPEAAEYSYKFNEITAEGYPAVVDFIKKEAGYEDTGTTELSTERNFISDSHAWSFKLDEQFITVFLFDNSKAAQSSLDGFSLKGYKYLDPVSKQSARLLWEHTPDFYIKENVLVIYSGQSKEIGRIIEKQVGNMVTVSTQ